MACLLTRKKAHRRIDISMPIVMGVDDRRPVRRPLQDTSANANFLRPRRPQRGGQNKRYNDSDGLESSPRAVPPDPPETPTPSSRPPPRIKAHIGPWILGRTLGRGSSGSVRLAKHRETGQLAAVKIIGKRMDGAPASINDPLSPRLEREVVIMKLISHPNIMGLWDVWENGGEL
jgi:Protein kinase domain